MPVDPLNNASSMKPRSGLEAVGAGAIVTYDGAPARIHSFVRDSDMRPQWLLDTGEELRRVPLLELFATLADRAPAPTEDDVSAPLLQELPDEERRRIETRYRDLLQVRTGSLQGDPEDDRRRGVLATRYDPTRTTYTQRLEAKSTELRERGEAGASVVTLRRQVKDVEAGGIEVLIHGNRRTGPQRLPDVGEEVITVVTEVLADQPKQARVSTRALVTKARAALQKAGVGDEVSTYKLRGLVSELSRSMDLHLAAKGRERTALKPRRVYGRHPVSRPGEVVQVDATTTNIHVWDPRLGWVRSTIVTAIDVFTRCVVAMRVVTGSVTSRDVAMLLWDIGRPTVTRAGYPYELCLHHGIPRLIAVNRDPEVQAGYGEALGAKPAFTPSLIVMDHGREFDSTHFLGACARVGVDVVFCPPKAPHVKGVIESFHNSLREVQSLLAGYKGANVENHPEGVEERAALTAHDLRDALWEYVLEVYHHAPHRGLMQMHDAGRPLSPVGVYEAYLASGGEVAVPRDPYQFIRLLTSVRCALHPYGLNVGGRRYNNATLVALRNTVAAGLGAPTQRLTVFYDRSDVSRVYLRHPHTGEWLCIPRSDVDPDTRLPCSDVFDAALRRQLVRGEDHPLMSVDLEQARARFARRWDSEVADGRKAQRLLAYEASRAHQYAHDLRDAPPEVRDLAFGEGTRAGQMVAANTADSDELLDQDLAGGDEVIDLDDLPELGPQELLGEEPW